jgi:two-component system, chemotaxis family, protein-glutamate methylesterase/glutaminase
MAKAEVVMGKLIVMGGSSGSLQFIIYILGRLPKDYPIPVLLIIHRAYSIDSMLLDLLVLKSNIQVREVEEKDKIVPSCVYLAPSDYHVLIEKDETFTLDYSEKLNFSRPSIDVSFISAAMVYGKNLTGILLSGANEDGAEGLKEIKLQGGHTIIQHPEEAVVSYMPLQASQKSRIDQVLHAEGILRYLISLIPA